MFCQITEIRQLNTHKLLPDFSKCRFTDNCEMEALPDWKHFDY